MFSVQAVSLQGEALQLSLEEPQVCPLYHLAIQPKIPSGFERCAGIAR
jgi:hypothetical protein